MKKFTFAIIASGLDPEADDFEDRFFEAGCDDATISIQKGAIILEFSREARSLSHALKSAMSAVQDAGATVVQIEPDHLVNLSDIAARAGMTRAAASHYAKGERGKGFPTPIMRVTTDSPLWDWVEVARWLHHRDRLSLQELLCARVVRTANVAIAARNEGHWLAFQEKQFASRASAS